MNDVNNLSDPYISWNVDSHNWFSNVRSKQKCNFSVLVYFKRKKKDTVRVYRAKVTVTETLLVRIFVRPPLQPFKAFDCTWFLQIGATNHNANGKCQKKF